MYRCEKCDALVAAGTPANHLVVKRRSKEYPSRSREILRGRGYRRTETIDRGGEGHEIVREATVCPACAEKYDAIQTG